MSERERWVVYPLLFLALGASLRDKLVDRTTSKSIACQELLIVDEQPLGREPVLLARLGGMPREKAEDPYNGQLVLNGQIEVIDRDLNQYHAANRVVTIGRARFGPKGVVGGHVGVNGQMVVNGAINATFYAYQGQPILPVLRGVFPGASLPAELLRAMPHALAPRPSATTPESAPPATESPTPPTTKPPESTGAAGTPSEPSPADEESSDKPPLESPPSAAPLADPEDKQ
jgi:hypothetical protein